MQWNYKTKIALFFAILSWTTAAAGAVFFYRNNAKGSRPALSNPVRNITALLPGIPGGSASKADLPLKLLPGFSISILSKNLPGARVMLFDRQENLWISQTPEGKISQLIIQNNKVIEQRVVFKNLDNPHGLAFDPENSDILYIAEQNKISKVELGSGNSPEKIIDLPNGGEHITRTIGFGPDGRLYVAVGSTCNVCKESDSRRAAIYSIRKDGSDFKQVASGLRNSVFFTWDQQGQMWATDMGRDNLGDNLPPDEINIIQEGKNYGWPICYGQNIHDTDFDKSQYIRDPCSDKIPPRMEIPAHSAPLGLTFVPIGSNWPGEYQGSLIVAYHGSWNRTVPTGYKLVRIRFDDKGNLSGIEDFISGWLNGSEILGRPVDVIFYNGLLYISDDKAGVIYRVEYNNKTK